MLSKLTKPWTDGNGPCYGAFSWACNCYQMRFQVIRFAFNCYQAGEHERSSNRMARTPNRLKWLLFWNSPPCTTARSSYFTLTGTRQWACQGFSSIQIYICIFSIQIDISMSARGCFICLLVLLLPQILWCKWQYCQSKLVFDLTLISAKMTIYVTFSV